MSATGPRPELRVKQLARDAGFDLVRITSASEFSAARAHYLAWIQAGRHAGMRWIDAARAERSSRPASVLPEARSVIALGMAYGRGGLPAGSPATGRIARYAWGRDYHQVLGDRLQQLGQTLQREMGGEHRWYVDTGPMMDKALAERAGLGWYGKNTNILTEQFGSYVLLGEIITSLSLAPDPPLARTCGACRLCLDACPTGALGPEYSIDSGRCISYLTIEHRESIPRSLRASMGDWVYGCDICQDVCPPSAMPYLPDHTARRSWAQFVRRTTASPQESLSHVEGSDAEIGGSALYAGELRRTVDLYRLLVLTHDEYLEMFRGSAIRRAKVWMLRRNAAVALGNVGEPEAAEALRQAMSGDEHPLVRGHAAWALARVAQRHEIAGAAGHLSAALKVELDSSVRAEIVSALEDLGVSMSAKE